MAYLIVVFMALAMRFTHATFPLEMKKYINTAVDPCHDFYQYACGTWLNTEKLNPASSEVSSYTIINDRNYAIIQEILKEKHPVVTEMWESCMLDPETTDTKALQKDLNRIANAQTTPQLFELAGEFARTETFAFLKIFVKPDPLDNTINGLYGAPPDMILPTQYYLDRSILNAYQAYINDIMRLSGFSLLKKRKRDDNRSSGEIVIDIETHLIQMQQQYKYTINRLPISNLYKYLPLTLGPYITGMGLFKHGFITMEKSLYFANIEKWVLAHSIDDLKHYFAFLLVQSRMKWLGQDFNHLSFRFFNSKLKGQPIPAPRKRVCTRRLVDDLPHLIGMLYYNKAFDQQRQGQVEHIVELIKDAMNKRLETVPWLTQASERTAAKTKLHHVNTLIGHATEYEPSLPEFSRDDYYLNMYLLKLHRYQQKMHKIGKRVNPNEWIFSSALPNAYYAQETNTMVFPAAILQPPLFHGPSVHPARNFGAIGYILGHELTHGFDHVGRYYNEHGHIRNWWSSRTLEEFEERSKCMVNQYSSFQIHGQDGLIGHVNGTLTLIENIADNGGLALAWDAYHQYMTSHQPMFQHVTKEEGEQMFFIAYGQSLCKILRDQKASELLQSDTHAPNEWRVNGILMHNDDFAKVFQCKVNTRMNPKEKCRIW